MSLSSIGNSTRAVTLLIKLRNDIRRYIVEFPLMLT